MKQSALTLRAASLVGAKWDIPETEKHVQVSQLCQLSLSTVYGVFRKIV